MLKKKQQDYLYSLIFQCPLFIWYNPAGLGAASVHIITNSSFFLCSTCSRPGTLTHYPLFLPQFIQLLEPKYIQIHPQESYNLLWPLVERKAGAKTDWHAAASWSYQLSESSLLREAVPSQGCTGQQRTPDQDEVLQTSREHFK